MIYNNIRNLIFRRWQYFSHWFIFYIKAAYVFYIHLIAQWKFPYDVFQVLWYFYKDFTHVPDSRFTLWSHYIVSHYIGVDIWYHRIYNRDMQWFVFNRPISIAFSFVLARFTNKRQSTWGREHQRRELKSRNNEVRIFYAPRKRL